MSNALKCPNPSCPYLFDPSQVPAGAVLTCPRCGMRFTLGPPAPPTQPPGYLASAPTQTYPGYPSATTTTLPPSHQPPGYGPPPQPPAFPEPPAPPPPPTGPDGKPPPPRRSGRPLPSQSVSTGNTLLLVVVGVALMAGVGLMVYFRLNPIRSSGGGSSAGEMRERNLAFDPPPAPWAPDDDTRLQLGSPFHLAYKREGPEAYMAFGSRDYETRMPRPSELRDGLTKALNTLFEEVETTPIEGGKWMGLPATAFEFRGRTRNGGPTMVGECHAVGAKGMGYWAVCWSAEGDAKAAFPEFDDTRNRFRLLDARDKWAAKEGTTRPFGGHKVSYQVLDGEGIWSEPAVPKANEVDPAGDLYLLAKEKRKGNDFPDEAELVVLTLDPAGGDPLAQGVKYVKEQRVAEVEKTPGVKVVYTDRPGSPEGDPANPIDPTAPVARFEERVQGASGLRRLRVVSAKQVGGKVVVVSAWCAWDKRRVFEDRLTQIAGSLREGP